MIFGRDDYDEMGIKGLNTKIPKDEPVFLIRAQDLYGALAVRDIALLYDRYLGKNHPMSKLAEEQAIKMNKWRKANRPDRKPDVPRELAIKTYTKNKNNDNH